jgi:acyl-CoA synthetase (AMP-forming)/AMP-acid ligase II
MIGRHLKEGSFQYGDRIALIQGSVSVTYGDISRLLSLFVEARGELSKKRVGLCTLSPMTFSIAVAALDLLQSHAFLVGPQSLEELSRLKHVFAWDYILRDEDIQAAGNGNERISGDWASGSGLVTILTSGTTGTPKAINHSWDTLASPVRRDSRYTETRWLLTYPLYLYAGTQVFLHAFLNWATLVIPMSFDPDTIARTLKDQRVTHSSGTPTFWRRLLFWGPKDVLRDCELEQITMGGEVVTQDLLDGLRAVFPRARIVHIYASTELGRMFSVTDGREGFPAKFLQEPPDKDIALRIVDGELMARGRHRMISCDGHSRICEDADGWIATGDLVELCGERVLFRGRRNDLINVGGRKVSPLQVETVIRGLPGILDVRVYGKKSSVIGQLVAADVVLAPGFSEETASTELRRAASRILQPYEIPQIVRVLPKIASNEALKVIRSEDNT